jgi:membrane protease YdiL (CAAX protease family)
MAVKLNGSALAGDSTAGPPAFPYSNWGPLAAFLGVLLALFLAAVLTVPVAIVDHPSGNELSAAANAIAQVVQELAFFLVPFGLAMWRGADSLPEAGGRLGLRRFRPSALLWMLGAYVLYIAIAVAYVALFGEPHQEDLGDKLGPVGVQILLIVLVVPICEEVCFRGMLFGGLRERMPGFAAALVSGLVFGALHATTGVSAVPPLMAFGVILALLYERTGSIVPGILLHMLNNSIALLGQ